MLIRSKTLRSVRLVRLLNPPPVTSVDVRAFWDYMCARHNVGVIRKSDSASMKVVAELLDRMGVLARESFLLAHTTVVPIRPVRGIYAPFEPGVPDERWSLWSQIEVCTHEMNHMVQAERAGRWDFSWDYITSSAARAHYEAGAYRCNLELALRYRGRVLNCGTLAYKLVNYGCSNLDCETTEKQLLMTLPAIRKGAMIEPATREAVDWLDERFGLG